MNDFYNPTFPNTKECEAQNGQWAVSMDNVDDYKCCIREQKPPKVTPGEEIPPGLESYSDIKFPGKTPGTKKIKKRMRIRKII